MVQDPQLPSNAFGAIFLPSVEHIDSFIENNQALFDAFKGNKNFQPKLVYHSMPLECIENPVYQKEFMARFDPTVMHILDCSETNREEYSKTRAITLSKMIKLI